MIKVLRGHLAEPGIIAPKGALGFKTVFATEVFLALQCPTIRQCVRVFDPHYAFRHEDLPGDVLTPVALQGSIGQVQEKGGI